MKTLIALAVFVAAQSSFAGIVREPVVISEEALRAKGVVTSKTTHQGTVSSVTIDVKINPVSEGETFEALEFVVCGTDVLVESLSDIDSYAYSKASRRERISERTATFDAFGKDVGRAYLVFEFLVPSKSAMAHYRRYLLPLSAVHEKQG